MKRLFNILIVYIYSFFFRSVGKRFCFHPFSSRFRGAQRISFGDRVFIGHDADFSIHTSLVVGDDTLFGPGVMILSGNHPTNIIGKRINESRQGINGDCVIGRDVWVGARVIIVGPVTIGEGSVVGAGAYVNRDIPPYVIAAGVPCKTLRARFSDQELRRHLSLQGRGSEFERIRSHRARFISGINK